MVLEELALVMFEDRDEDLPTDFEKVESLYR